MRTALFLLALCAVSGCDSPPKAGDAIDSYRSLQGNGRFIATYQSSFVSAMTQRDHGVFIVTDIKTGRRYLAIEGCGVSTIEEHNDGEQTVQVEQ